MSRDTQHVNCMPLSMSKTLCSVPVHTSVHGSGIRMQVLFQIISNAASQRPDMFQYAVCRFKLSQWNFKTPCKSDLTQGNATLQADASSNSSAMVLTKFSAVFMSSISAVLPVNSQEFRNKQI